MTQNAKTSARYLLASAICETSDHDSERYTGWLLRAESWRNGLFFQQQRQPSHLCVEPHPACTVCVLGC
jgi:hypothetical protein